MLGYLTDFASSPRGKWVTLVAWLFAAGLLISQLPMLNEATENEQALFLPATPEQPGHSSSHRNVSPRPAHPF